MANSSQRASPNQSNRRGRSEVSGSFCNDQHFLISFLVKLSLFRHCDVVYIFLRGLPVLLVQMHRSSARLITVLIHVTWDKFYSVTNPHYDVFYDVCRIVGHLNISRITDLSDSL